MRYQPMMAKVPENEQELLRSPDHVVEVKLDGHRAMLEIVDDKMALWSRLGHNNIGMMVGLREMTRYASELYLDGEMVVPGGSSSDVADLSRRSELVYVVFDILSWNGEELVDRPYSERREMLETLVYCCRDVECLQIAEVYEDAEELLAQVEIAGGEGVMMKRKDAPYMPGKRSWHWQKVKCFSSYDVVVTSCDAKPTEWHVRPGAKGTDGKVYPDGLHTDPWVAGHVGLTYGWYVGGGLKTVGSLGYTGPWKELQPLVGKVVEVKGYGLYKTGAIRHPGVLRFRDDKRPIECLFENEQVTL